MSGFKVAVLGGGAWGTALALNGLRAGHSVGFWMRDEDTAQAINADRANPRYLPGLTLDPGLAATTNLADALDGAACALLVAPAQALRALATELVLHAEPNLPLVICAKGIERETGLRLSQVLADLLPGNPVAALSGPSFATDVARGLPTALTVAAEDADLAARLAVLLSTPGFRCYSTDDLVGVEIGGALKNVLAIAAGCAAGAELGASAQAALVTRGFVEMRRLAASFGARPETLMGLSGLGDLILTCASAQSRNFAYGVALGSGAKRDGMKLAEGVATAGIAARIAAERSIEAPITETIALVLDRRITVGEAMQALLSRPLKSEA